jgi:hypothetical protein
MALLSNDQERFAETLSGITGLNLNVVRAWVLSEGGNGPGTDHNWLNITNVPAGYKSKGTRSRGGEPQFQSADQAAQATAALITKQYPTIGASVGGSVQDQILAIVNSPWASGHYLASAGNPMGTIGNNYASAAGSQRGAATAAQSIGTNASTQVTASGGGNKFFSTCHSGTDQVTSNIPGTNFGGISVPVPAVTCYLTDGLEIVALALGGLLLMALGGIMIVSGKHPAAAAQQARGWLPGGNQQPGPTDFQIQQEARRQQTQDATEAHRVVQGERADERLDLHRQDIEGVSERHATTGPSLNVRREAQAVKLTADAHLKEVQADLMPDMVVQAAYEATEKIDLQRSTLGERTSARKGEQKIKRQRLRQDQPVKEARARDIDAAAGVKRATSRSINEDTTRRQNIRRNIIKGGTGIPPEVEKLLKVPKIKGKKPPDPSRMQ